MMMMERNSPDIALKAFKISSEKAKDVFFSFLARICVAGS